MHFSLISVGWNDMKKSLMTVGKAAEIVGDGAYGCTANIQ
jgi:hypothetical protein